jgi:nitrogen-specific signal transduction histidine kinase
MGHSLRSVWSFCKSLGVSWVSKWLLPTLSDVLASEVLAFNDEPATAHASPNGIGAAWDDAPNRVGTVDSTVAQDPLASLHRNQSAFHSLRAEREWYGAIASVQQLLQSLLNPADDSPATLNLPTVTKELPRSGLVLSGPTPVISQPDLFQHLAMRTLATPTIHSPDWTSFPLLPVEAGDLAGNRQTPPTLPLLPGDPLADEPFCLVLTPWFSLVMVLGEGANGELAFRFSFSPDVVQRSWETIRPRIMLMNSQQVDYLDEFVQQFPPVTPDYKTVMQFSRLLLANLPEPSDEWPTSAGSTAVAQGSLADGSAQSPDRSLTEDPPVGLNHSAKPKSRTPVGQRAVVQSDRPCNTVAKAIPAFYTSEAGHASAASPDPSPSTDVELLQAIAHEVRTPLTTIRTLTRSLLKRMDLPPDVLRRLGIIDRECSEQIDRFGLFFRAVELETATTQSAPLSLTRTSLADVFQQNIPRWQQQATQRQMALEFILPATMPTVVSDPTMLDQALTSLIERFTRNLPAGSHIQVDVTLAGEQLKLQLQSVLDTGLEGVATGDCSPEALAQKAAKAIGQMLMFQPETGSLSLNLTVTKNIFQAIGGKLTVKQRPKQGEVMTVYLPLEMGSSSPLENSKVITV